jgi:hypothetical protein
MQKLDPKLISCLKSKSPLDILGFKSKLGITLDVTWFLFRRFVLDTIERSYLEGSAALVQLDELAVLGSSTDIYGCKYEVDNGEFVKCSICDRSIMCSKYAPHLEKCLGMGRNRKKSNSSFSMRDESEQEEQEAFYIAEPDDEYVDSNSKRRRN